MIKAKYLKVKYAHQNMVQPEHPIQFGAVVQPSWTKRRYMVYLTGDYKFEGMEGWFIQGYPLNEVNVPSKMGCGWLNELAERTGDVIKTHHKNKADEVKVLWEPKPPASQMELKL